MPFEMKIQPIGSCVPPQPEAETKFEPVKAAAVKSRFKRLFERQFILRTTPPLVEKESGVGGEFEPSSVCLENMVQNFMEESGNEKQRCNRNRCNCFNGNNTTDDSSDDESEVCELLKSLVLCASQCERNLLADAARIVEKNNKLCKHKEDNNARLIDLADRLLDLGYDASVCKSRWEKTPAYPCGEYEYIDVIVGGERLLIDVDFRSEFEIARPSKRYREILATLPFIFVGKADRLGRIAQIVAEAGKQSLKKKGMPVPPWRKAEYIKAKWLSPHTRATVSNGSSLDCLPEKTNNHAASRQEESLLEMLEGEEKKASVKEWKLPEVKPRRASGVKVVTGLASVMSDENEP